MESVVDLDAMAVRAARGGGALELELGEVLARLFEGNRLMDLGYSQQTDYLRERLGIAARTGLGWASLARGLATRLHLGSPARAVTATVAGLGVAARRTRPSGLGGHRDGAEARGVGGSRP